MIKSTEGSAGLLHKITKPTMWRGGVQTLKKEEEDARLLERFETKREWSKHWQCDESVQNVEDKHWKNEELKKLEEPLPRLTDCDLEKASRLYKEKTGVGCDGFHPKVPLDVTKETRGEILEFLEKLEQSGKWPQQACTTKNVTSERPIALMPTLIRWWEAMRAPEVARWQQKYRVDWDATDGRNGGAQRTVCEVLLEMEEFDGRAKAEDQGAVALVLDQDALSEVTHICPSLKLRVFVEDTTALVKGRSVEVAEMAKKKVMKKLQEEVEKEGVKLSVKTIASCGFLEKELSQFSKEEGVTLADRVETLGVGLRTRIKKLGGERKSEKKKVEGEVLDYQEE